MKTVVYQSFRTENVPSFISRCMDTVRHWAGLRGFDYRFIDDRMFDYAPDWYREKADNDKCLVSDLTRLELAREFLSGGYQRSVWVDADIVIFEPDGFTVEISEGFALCREIWVDRKSDWFRPPVTAENVNNSVSVFCSDNDFLDYYIDKCKSIVRNTSILSPIEVGTKFLTSHHKDKPLKLIQDVGLFSPVVMNDIATGGRSYLRAYGRDFRTRIHAANLCNSFLGKKFMEIDMTEQLYDLVIDRLMETRGEVVNRFMK